MKLSKKAYYGLRAALALQQASNPLSIHLLAKSESLPEEYLEKILQDLRKKDIVIAKRGITGGYSLKRKNISAWEVIFALDGPLKVYTPTVQGVLPCEQITHCQTNSIFRSVEQNLEKTLRKISLQSLSQK